MTSLMSMLSFLNLKTNPNFTTLTHSTCRLTGTAMSYSPWPRRPHSLPRPGQRHVNEGGVPSPRVRESLLGAGAP